MIIAEVLNIIVDAYELSKDHFLGPENRIYYLYLLSSLLLALFVYLKRRKKKKSFFSYVFDKRIWMSKSALNDYLIFSFNNLFKVLFIGPYLIIGLYIAFYINENLIIWFGYPEKSLSIGQTMFFYTVALTLINDFLSFVVHLALHKIPVLWEFHKVHHSATTLNPMTQYRIHPIELVLNNVRGIIGFGFVTGIFDYYSNHELDNVVFIGANIFTFLFMFFGANLRHSHVKLKYPNFLEYILISPYQHQIHHSINKHHYDKNMGSKLAIWDFIFGTLILSKQTSRIRFGVEGNQRDYSSFTNLIWLPFLKAFNRIKMLKKVRNKDT